MEVPSPEALASCLETLEKLSTVDRKTLGALPDIGKILAAGYSLARRSGRSLRDPTWTRPGAEPKSEEEEVPRTKPTRFPEPPAMDEEEEEVPFHACYRCLSTTAKRDKTFAHFCLDCAEFERKHRAEQADFTGRIALVTGARIRIGYAVVLRLLRSGARVIATTRFPAHAWSRFQREPDANAWIDRLELISLDLRHLPSVLTFAQELCDTLPKLDLLVNNAARTIDHPGSWEKKLWERENDIRKLLPGFDETKLLNAGTQAVSSADLSHVPTEDPPDERTHNAWRSRMGEVAPEELLSVHAINALAPYLLVHGLRPLMARPPREGRWIINVASAEGQFYRKAKSPFHPHSNMAKAALNMLTRTCSGDLSGDRIFMASVDTGWVSDQNPIYRTDGTLKDGFVAPVDPDGAAARILHPMVRMLNGESPVYGVLLKDFVPAPW